MAFSCFVMHPKTNHNDATPCRVGAAALELAIVLPFVLLLTFGACDFGRAIHVAIAISNACRAGAEYASLHGFTDHTESMWRDRVEETIRAEVAETAAIDPNAMEIEITHEPDDDGLPVTTVHVHYTFASVIKWEPLPSSTELNRECTMRRTR